MIRCPNCKSYAVTSTGLAYATYPLRREYRCLDCKKIFSVSEGAVFDQISESKDVTSVLLSDFFDNILRTGEIPNTLNYYNHGYGFFVAEKDNYYYSCPINDKYELIHLHIEKEDITEADRLSEELADFYERLREKY